MLNSLAHLIDQTDTISVILSESDDTSTADADACFSNGREGVQSIVVFSGRDDLQRNAWSASAIQSMLRD